MTQTSDAPSSYQPKLRHQIPIMGYYIMVKFFLEKDPHKKSPTDYRIISYFKMLEAVKRIKQFAIQKTIKKLKQTEDTKLEERLTKLKSCHNDILRILTVWILKTECRMELEKQQKFFESKADIKLNQIDQKIQQLEETEIEYLRLTILKHHIYRQTIDDIQGLLVKVQKKINATKQKKLLKKERVRQRKEEEKTQNTELQQEHDQMQVESKEPAKIKTIKKLNNNKQQNERVKTRYDNRPKPKPRTQFKKTGRNRHLAQKKQKQKKTDNPFLNPNQSTHPSWQAKLEQNTIVPFQGKRIILK